MMSASPLRRSTYPAYRPRRSTSAIFPMAFLLTVDGDEGRIGDDIERLFAAVVGMSSPADVGEEAGSVA